MKYAVQYVVWPAIMSHASEMDYSIRETSLLVSTRFFSIKENLAFYFVTSIKNEF